ncbi:phenylalanine-4-hydroxylase [Anseongella ginsenosidimutans]|uniref:Phenylalanine-4-hydroxylase n=1 Tax=Anseongella ginsenosidimutans TaxID=496056 RepID=A0A4R3KWV9_9SPHI|nr:aromatic amino acid hydroxylase [Anseongella ginsenosidimutans]QEC51047.1 aromatic amino acid hydroxylase [Anseongella ginsenosidimutans]TCS90297.1 phenylalanine-4-hydroxylase [Anseongella ginsenosidimutans]
MNDFNNPVLKKLPAHLRQYLVEQHYENYTPIDHAVWRYVMRQNYSYLKDVAYYPYIPGLKKAGLSIERIPNLQTMNDHLRKLGWGAATVKGFIPPAAFMEFQACRVLVIAADIRQIGHIEYTPAPDIIHESAGHAPIIADPDYAEYLRYFGEIGARAIFSRKDFQLYEAIRRLSVLKEMPAADPREISKAEEELAERQRSLGQPSEMALLSRLHWWTVEYGLIGTLENPKIYGAGLLSSIGESVTCMQPSVKKLPYTIETVNYPYDITQPQPQLFVTPDFENLLNVLEHFAGSMAFRRGGLEGILKAVECGETCTVVYSSGLQVSGVFRDVDVDGLVYIQTSGPSALATDGKQLPGQGPSVHPGGYGSPVGKLKGYSIALEDFSPGELKSIGLERGKFAKLEFENGLWLEGLPQATEYRNGKLILISFTDCTVKDGKTGKLLFEPSMGKYHMGVGEKILSVFYGPADREAFDRELKAAGAGKKPAAGETLAGENSAAGEIRGAGDMPGAREGSGKAGKAGGGNVHHGQGRLGELYQKVRDVRERRLDATALPKLWQELKERFPADWLCALEILEILESDGIFKDIATEIASWLEQKSVREPALAKLISDGLAVMRQPGIEALTR